VKSISYLKFAIDSLPASPVEWSYLNTDMRKFESSQKSESKAQSADSSKAYRKPRALFVPHEVYNKSYKVIKSHIFHIRS